MTRRPRASALPPLSPSLAARNPALAPSPRPARPTPRTAPPGASAGVVVELPGLRLVNPLNHRQGWRAVSERGRREKAVVGAALRGHKPPALPVVVTITRVSPGRLDDDGATASAKHVRDAVAEWLGCDDGDPRVTWAVVQAKGAAAVRIAAGPRVTCPTCGCAVVASGRSEGR